ncbi:MAG: FaeA/PapI family transcriptional regulator [Methanotrichaceae archaeon]
MASYEERILKVIDDSEVGLTTVDVAKKAGVSKTTAIKYLSVLKSEGKCEFVEVGPSKLWRVVEPEVEEARAKAEINFAGSGSKVDGDGKMIVVPLSVIGQLEEISEDVIISMSFRVKPDKVDNLAELMKRCIQQKGVQRSDGK